MRAKAFLEKLNHDEIVAAIAAAEGRTSGELRVFVSRKAVEDPVAAAEEEFERLGMSATAERNGVLIYVAPRSNRFAVVGDRGVHEKCGQEFWEDLARTMSGHFANGEFTRGIVLGVQRAGDLLARHFPRREDDQNELPNDVARD